jgi:hypothetical protein
MSGEPEPVRVAYGVHSSTKRRRVQHRLVAQLLLVLLVQLLLLAVLLAQKVLVLQVLHHRRIMRLVAWVVPVLSRRHHGIRLRPADDLNCHVRWRR